VSAAGPIGGWTAEVRRPRGRVTETLHFTPAGRVFLLPRGGSGWWCRADDDRFTFTIAEPVLGDDGAFRGWVRIEQSGIVRDGRFASSGTSRVYDADGAELYTATVSISARPQAPALAA
jgi:hypothetical protein